MYFQSARVGKHSLSAQNDLQKHLTWLLTDEKLSTMATNIGHQKHTHFHLGPCTQIVTELPYSSLAI